MSRRITAQMFFGRDLTILTDFLKSNFGPKCHNGIKKKLALHHDRKSNLLASHPNPLVMDKPSSLQMPTRHFLNGIQKKLALYHDRKYSLVHLHYKWR